MLAVDHYVKDGAETLFVANQDCNRRRDVAVKAKWPVEGAELWDSHAGPGGAARRGERLREARS